MTKAEMGYSKVEEESLAVLTGCKTNSRFLYGTEFEVITDHLPLVPLYNNPNRPAPVRVERHRSKLRSFQFKIKYKPGHLNPRLQAGTHHHPGTTLRLRRKSLGWRRRRTTPIFKWAG